MRAKAQWSCFLALLLFSGSALAVNVRGRIDIFGPYGIVPMVGAVVGLCNNGGCWSFRTGYDGMYYISAPPGQFAIVVNGVTRANIFIPNSPSFDVAPIRGN